MPLKTIVAGTASSTLFNLESRMSLTITKKLLAGGTLNIGAKRQFNFRECAGCPVYRLRMENNIAKVDYIVGDGRRKTELADRMNANNMIDTLILLQERERRESRKKNS